MPRNHYTSDELKKMDLQYLWHNFVHIRDYVKEMIVLDHAEGCYFWDVDGKKYLDAVSGVEVMNLGYNNVEILRAIQDQMERLNFSYISYAGNEATIVAAKKLIELSPKNMKKVFFVNSGSEGADNAIKLARQYHVLTGNKGKYKVIARWMSYHGSTIGALSATGHTPRREMFQPLLIDFPHIPPPYCYRCFFHLEYPECGLECAHALETTIKTEGAESISAFMFEPIVGFAGGAIVPPREYYDITREICQKYDVLMIADEVLVGLCRTGKVFACEHWNLSPDMLFTAKGLAGGYAATGAVLTSDKIVDVFEDKNDKAFLSGCTFGGHPIASAATIAFLDIIVRERIWEKAAQSGDYLFGTLKNLNRRIIGDIRGKGMLASVELVKNRETKKIFGSDEDVGGQIAFEMLKKGIKVFGSKGFDTGMISDFIFLAPPLTMTTTQIDYLVSTLDDCIAETESELG